MDANQNTNIREIVDLIQTNKNPKSLRYALEDYHDNDLADAIALLTKDERLKLYQVIGVERTAEVFSYLEEDLDEYISEIDIKQAAKIVSEMDADDAVDLLEEIDDTYEERLISLLDATAKHDVKLIQSYDDSQIGSKMTMNCITIRQGLTIKEAMRELVAQSEDNDNINMLYVLDEKDTYVGVIDLRDLIRARANDNLADLIMDSYPVVFDTDIVEDVLEDIADYAENSLPVVNADARFLGVITSQDIIESVGQELTEDYAKLGGLTSSEDLQEPLIESIKKRLPWLFALLFLGIGVSAVVGIFENVVKEVAIIVCFQSLVLDMAGNVGTQSLAVTIRVLMDEDVSPKDRLRLIMKEVSVGFSNGLILGIISFLFIGLYVWLLKGYPMMYSFTISACVGIALLIAMVISSLVGTVVPILFNAIHVDPAVASGPFITTINDLVAVISYYGLAWILLVNVFHV